MVTVMMRTTQKQVLVALLVITVLVAGCVGGGSEEEPDTNQTERVSVTQNDGLTALFSSRKDTYREGEPIEFELVLENTGERMANGITTQLTGASFIAGVEPQFPGRPSLQPVDRSENKAGEDTRVRWQIANPVNLERGFVESYPAKAWINYNYQTRARGAFTAVSGKDFDGESSPITTQTSAGPLSVDIEMESPTPVYPSDNQQTEIPVSVKVVDRGDGAVENLNGDQQPIHVQTAEFPNTDKAALECPPTISLFDGEGRLSCTAYLPSDVIEEQFTMQIVFAYSYLETQELSFQIEGLEGDQSSR